MKVVEELGEQQIAVIITGDGSEDKEIIEALADRFNGKADLGYPAAPGSLRGATGLSCLRVLKTYIRWHSKFLLFIDKEHLGRDPKEEVRRYLQGIGIEVENADAVNEIYIFKGVIGSKTFILYVIPQGFEKHIEENVVRLIQLHFKDEVEPNLHVVKKWLRKNHKMELYDFIKKVRKKELTIAFPNHTRIFSLLEAQINV